MKRGGRRGEQRGGGLLNGDEGGLLRGAGRGEAGGLGGVIPCELALLKLRLEPATKAAVAGAQRLIDGGWVGGVTGRDARRGGQTKAGEADPADEVGFEPVVMSDGLIASGNGVIELTPKVKDRLVGIGR